MNGFYIDKQAPIRTLLRDAIASLASGQLVRNDYILIKLCFFLAIAPYYDAIAPQQIHSSIKQGRFFLGALA